MADSPDMFGDPTEGEDEGAQSAPSAAELEAAGQSALFGGEAAPVAATPAPASPPEPGAYRVLARKYRPQTFAELLGQDAMVQTLANAIRRDRIAHAFLMTGVRGVGKTSTARLIAKALNCVGPDGQGGPTIDPCGVCEPCRAIAEGRHIDVIEMDAASHTGVDDVREIIEAVRYAAVSARYKIYIIDEVHMLSRNAFNALLKTLEEPPAHVKFLFATTEVDKLPVTVLSRCQRFDLRRIPLELLTAHFGKVCTAEGVGAEDEALAMIATAAEGSARDGLSILDQAIAHAGLEEGSRITADQVRDMLGLADRTMQRRLFAALVGGDAAGLLGLLAEQHALGVDPLAVLRAQLEIVHQIAVTQVGQSGAPGRTAEERAIIGEWAGQIAAGRLHRLWQLLLKGFEEVRQAPDPLVAAEMALLRVLHADDLPDPGALIRRLETMRLAPAATAEAAAPVAAPAPTMGALADRLEQAGHLRLAQVMRDWLRPVEVGEAVLRYQLAPGLAEDPAGELRDALSRVTGERWEVERVAGDAAPTLREQAETEKQSAHAAMLATPLVRAAFAAFPDAELVDEAALARGKPDWSRRA